MNDRGFGAPRGGFAPVNVGDELDVTIEAVGEKGDGIAKKKGFVLFIPNTKEGQTVRVRVTKVLRKLGFAEVIGDAQGPVETDDEQAEPAEEVPMDEAPMEEEAPEPSAEDSEDFGEEVPMDEAPMEEEAPAEEMPAEEEAPMDEAPEEVPEEPAEEMPEEAPEEAPAEEPAEEKPKEE